MRNVVRCADSWAVHCTAGHYQSELKHVVRTTYAHADIHINLCTLQWICTFSRCAFTLLKLTTLTLYLHAALIVCWLALSNTLDRNVWLPFDPFYSNFISLGVDFWLHVHMCTGKNLWRKNADDAMVRVCQPRNYRVKYTYFSSHSTFGTFT